jgi:hypothetical protein
VGKFKVLEVKQPIDPKWADAMEEVHKTMTDKESVKKKLIKTFSLKDVENTMTEKLQIAIKKYQTTYPSMKEWRITKGEGEKSPSIGLYFTGDYDRVEIFDQMMTPQGDIIRPMLDEYRQNYEDNLYVIIQDIFTKHKLSISDKEIETTFPEYIPVPIDRFYLYKPKSTPERKKEALLNFNNFKLDIPFTLKVVNQKGGRKKMEECGVMTDTKLEVVPIILAYDDLNQPFDPKDLSLEQEQVDCLRETNSEQNMKTADRKTKENYIQAKAQSNQIAKSIELNPRFKTIVRGLNDFYTQIREKGVELYIKTKKLDKGIDVNKYTPADYIMVKSKNIPVVEGNSAAAKLIAYNNLFANDLIDPKSGQLKAIKSGKFVFVGVSQKKTVKAYGGRSGQFFSVIKMSEFGSLKVKDSDENFDLLRSEYKEINTRLEKMEDIFELNINSDFATYTESDSKIATARLKMLRMLDSLISRTGRTKQERTEYFLDLVKFSMCAGEKKGKDWLNPCFYKLLGDKWEVYNNQRFNVELNIYSSKIKISYGDKFITLTIPLIMTIDTGEGALKNETFEVDVEFEILNNSVSPNMKHLEHIKKKSTPLRMSTVVGKETGEDNKRWIQILTNIGKGKEVERLKVLLKNKFEKTWFKEYRFLVYDFINKNIEKVKDASDKKEIIRSIKLDEVRTKKGIGTPQEISNLYNEILLSFKNAEGVFYDATNNKFIFTESLKPSQQKIDEILTKLDEYK